MPASVSTSRSRVQFAYFVRNFFEGNLGDSIVLKVPVATPDRGAHAGHPFPHRFCRRPGRALCGAAGRAGRAPPRIQAPSTARIRTGFQTGKPWSLADEMVSSTMPIIEDRHGKPDLEAGADRAVDRRYRGGARQHGQRHRKEHGQDGGKTGEDKR